MTHPSLNLSQQTAVDHTGSHLLIIAGPGTGKTHTLTHRIAKIFQQLQDHEKILAITFTNKAAQEMRGRLEKFACDLSRMEVGTFHSFCLKLLRKYCQEAGLSEDFLIADEETTLAVLKDLWPARSQKERSQIYDQISLYKSSLFGQECPSDVLLYNHHLNQLNRIDFDDILLKVFRLLQNNPKVLKDIQQTFRYIFVDEYQDVNAIQHELLKQLVGTQNHLTAIGDPNQAIYGFRGSNSAFFENFSSHFSPTTQLSLTENFRSLSHIIEASNQMMASSQSKYVPEVTSRIYSEGKLVIHSAGSEKAEAEYVVHTIEKIIGGTSMFSQDTGRVETQELGEVSFGDIAILYRLNSQRHALKEAFERSGIPYHCSSKEELLADGICPPRNVDVEIDCEKVSFLTMHASKGLEFPVVFVLGCEEGLMPLNIEGLISDVEEERRLFYVAMTRAKRRLYLLSAKKRFLFGQTLQNNLSPFVNDIAERLKERGQFKEKKKKQETQLSLFK